ncbi:YgiT-type zinc finger protein [Bdellovibrionota bacterium FG-1]
MKCLECENGVMKQQKITDVVTINGGVELKIKGVPVLRCSKCGDVLMDSMAIARTKHLALEALVSHYAKTLEIPGKVAHWMRDAIGLTVVDLAKKSKLSSSALSKAAERNTILDRFAAMTLLCLVVDHITGTKKASGILESTQHLEKLVNQRDARTVELSLSA